MKSNRCLFSKTIFQSDILRFLPFALLLLIAQVIIFPVFIFNNYHNNSYSYHALDLESFVSISAVSSGFVFVFAAVMALLVFSYLFTPNRCNALHAFPIGRKALYTTHFIGGYLLLTVPQLIAFCMALPGIFSASEESGAIIALQCAAIFGESLVYYTLAVLSVMLAANIFAGAVIYLMLNFMYSVFSIILNLSVTTFGYGIERISYDNEIAAYLSPVVRLFSDKLRVNEIGYELMTNESAEYTAIYYHSLLVLLIAAAVVAVLAYLLYKARFLECAGDMAAFKSEIPVFSVIVSILGGALLTALISAVLEFETIGMLTAYMIFSLLLFFAAQMILKKSAKVFQPKQFLLWAVACGLSIALVFGLAHYETNLIPKVEKVESVTLNATYDTELTEKADIETAEKLHALLIENRNAKGQEELTEFPAENMLSIDEYAYNSSYYVQLEYTLHSGKTIFRAYSFDDEDKEMVALLDKLEVSHQPQTVFERLADCDIIIKSIQVEDYSEDTYEEIYLDTSEFDTVYALCAEDAAAASKDYRSSKHSQRYRNDIYRVNFECAVRSDEDAEVIEQLAQQSEDVTGAFVYTDLPEEKAFTVTMTVSDDTPGILAYLQQR